MALFLCFLILICRNILDLGDPTENIWRDQSMGPSHTQWEICGPRYLHQMHRSYQPTFSVSKLFLSPNWVLDLSQYRTLVFGPKGCFEESWIGPMLARASRINHSFGLEHQQYWSHGGHCSTWHLGQDFGHHVPHGPSGFQPMWRRNQWNFLQHLFHPGEQMD